MAQLNTARISKLGGQPWISSLVYRIKRIPWQQLIGLILIVLAGVIFVVLIPRYQSLHTQQELQLVNTQQPRIQPTVVQRSPRDVIDAFYVSLPPETAAASELGRLLEIASAQGIAPDKVEYQLVRNSAAPFSAYQVTLPVRAPYVALQRFINGVLNAMPNAALREVSISRDESADGLVSARLRFALYLGPAR